MVCLLTFEITKNSFITIQQDTKFMKKMYKILKGLLVTLYTTIYEQLELQLDWLGHG